MDVLFHVIEVCDIEELSGHLMTIDFEKVFDSMNHAFLIAALKKYSFGNNFLDWIKQSRIICNKRRTHKQIF